MSLGWFKRMFGQAWPAPPKFTEKDIPDLHGKVYIITGANTGVGKDLAHILYSKNAKVYVGSRSKEKGTKAIEELRARSPQSKGELVLLQLDLADLTTIKAPVEEFLSRETRLDVLFNNAGVMAPPQGSKSAQGYELHLGTNNVGPHLLTRLLTPMLVATAKAEAEAGRRAAVRVVWVSSLATECFSPTGGVEMEHLNYHGDATWMYKYGVSKAGNYLQATEFARRHRGDGVVSVAVNPGNLDSELYRTQPSLLGRFMKTFVLWPSVYGAYTELFGGLSPEVTFEKTGAWIVPWGSFSPLREDVVASSKSKAEGGTGVAEEFWKWNEEQVKPYV